MKFKSWRSPKTIRKSGGLHGLGLFAVQPITKGEVVGVKTGHLVTEDFIKANQSFIRGSHVQISDELFYAPAEAAEWSDLLIGYNHSCEPNAYLRGACLMALLDIEPGEEITADYGTCYTSDTQEFDCLCNKPTCRKHIKPSTDWQNPELQKKYIGCFADFVQAKIDQQARS